MQQVFQRYGFFDPSGVLVGDGSHLFVPDNPACPGSVVLWFDEHNHPVEYDKPNSEERKKAQAPAPDAAKVLHRTEICSIKGLTSWSQCTVPIHVLLLRDSCADGHQDQWALRKTVDFADPRQPKDQYALRPQVEEGYPLRKCFHDPAEFHSQDFDVMAAQAAFIFLSYRLRQWQLWRTAQEDLAGKTPRWLRLQLSLYNEYIAIYHEHPYTQMPLVSFSRELLELVPEARAKALVKLRKLEASSLAPLEHLRAPP